MLDDRVDQQQRADETRSENHQTQSALLLNLIILHGDRAFEHALLEALDATRPARLN
jgi:hypothetical protein